MERFEMIRHATLADLAQIEDIFNELFSYERKNGAYTVWRQGVYPTRQTAEVALSEGWLYVAARAERLCGVMIINRVAPTEYGGISWDICAAPSEALICHLLLVRPSEAGRGIGKQMVRFAVQTAVGLRCKALRLDTGSQNIPAVKLYTGLGFKLADNKPMRVGGLIPHENHLFFELGLS